MKIQNLALICLVALLLSPVTKSHADVIKGEIPLGGASKALADFYDRGGSFYTDEDLHVLSAVMMLENEATGKTKEDQDLCALLTGSVLMNRAYYCDWCPDTLRGCVMQNYGKKGQQYASHTVENLDTVVPSERIIKLAKRLLIGGPICPRNVVFQSRYSHLGSDYYMVIEGEYFAYE